MLGTTARAVRTRIGSVLSARAAPSPRLTSRIHPVTLPLDPNHDTGFRLYQQYRGSTGPVASFSCHVSALAQGQCPHPPHTHSEEEILIMLQGEADLVLPSCPDGQRERRLTAGQFVYYPAHFPHTLRAVSPQPANYLMFKWRDRHRARAAPLGFQHVDLAAVHVSGERGGFVSRVLFEGRTAYLGKLHAHFSYLAPGAGYAPHVDEHDGAIVVLAGEVETLEHRVRPHGIIHYASGDPHGMRNPTSDPARYLVFEFHRRVPLLSKLTDARRWKRRLHSVWQGRRKHHP
jgi:quercetin dioxygenase-like cupin family protein